MVSEAFDGAELRTRAAFLANGYVSDRFGFDQGWDHYTNMIRESRSTEAEDVFREAGDWIEQHSDQRFFVVHPDDRSARPLRPARRVPGRCTTTAHDYTGHRAARAARVTCSSPPRATTRASCSTGVT
jgi:hypothetical protein